MIFLIQFLQDLGVGPIPVRQEISGRRHSRAGQERALRSAAVLVPLIDRAEGMTVLLTQRTDTMSDHAGQIAFPGGSVEPGEVTPEETALRETEEEIGLSASMIEVLGRMNARDTGTGYRVMPVVGLIQPPMSLVARSLARSPKCLKCRWTSFWILPIIGWKSVTNAENRGNIM